MPLCAQPGGSLSEVVFSSYSPFSSNPELVRRLLSPLTAAQVLEAIARSGHALSEQPVNLAQEKFVLYVPAHAPASGYALLVFVPPWDDARLPDGWASVLDQYGFIFVSAARSGNDASVLGRREPLAILAEQNVVSRYHVDPDRIYIAGFSGGSRVAMRLALGYPDIFRGALLDAGGDPIGDGETPLPPRDLFLRFQESTHLVYVTGDRDTFNLGYVTASIRSMRDWCVFNAEEQTAPFTDHDAIGSAALSRALGALVAPLPSDSGKLAACRADIEAQLTAKVQQVQSLVAAGQRDAARELLKDIDTRFGGLAAPQSLKFAAELAGNK